MENIGHQSLEAHICGKCENYQRRPGAAQAARELTLDSGDVLGAPEVVGSVVTSTLASVVDLQEYIKESTLRSACVVEAWT